MKKLRFIILLVSIFITPTIAQEFSMTDQGNKWGIRWFDGFCDGDPDSGCEPTGISLIEINGETIFNDITYANFEGGVFGNIFIREEEGIVYKYTESSGESILYDFTLEVGDTVSLGSEVDCIDDDNNNNLADVIDVSTQFIAGYDRKVITFDIEYGSNISGNVQWIEGIGSANESTNPDILFCDLVFVLDCFNNGEEIFSFSSDEECNELLNTPDVSKITTSLTPNPISEQSTLTINNFQNNTTISFYTILGQFINQKQILNSSLTIHRSDFPSSGIYFYQIKQQGKIVSAQKFIVK